MAAQYILGLMSLVYNMCRIEQIKRFCGAGLVS